MANKLISMQQVRTILQHLSKGWPQRKIARELQLSRNTVKQYADRLLSSSCSLTELRNFDDQRLSDLVYSVPDSLEDPGSSQRREIFTKKLPWFLSELKRKGVTRNHLWKDYLLEHPDGYGYSQFCERLSRYQKVQGATMHFDHKPGEMMMVDFAGTPLSYVDAETGEFIYCPVFVSVLPYSAYSYAVALANATIPQVIKALNESLEYLGGVPQTVKCDNMKQIVKKACRYEPVFTEALNQWATHYNIGLLTARVAKPKDKAPVENQVKLTYQRIYAPLRNETFHSLKALNQAIHKQLDIHHKRPFQRKDFSRSQCFFSEEQSLLQPLPAGPFLLKHSVQAKVQKNYHITLGEDWHHYSVPYHYIGKTLQVVYDTDEVEIYLQHQRVALHKRNYKKHGYTTVKEHMPEGHQKYFERKGWDASYFLTQAEKIGSNTYHYIEEVLKGKRFTEQTYNACLGLLRLGKTFGADRLETACKRALTGHHYTYRVVHNILTNNLDLRPLGEQTDLFTPPDHENIRGKDTYQ